MAITTEMAVAMMAMPNELRSAAVKSSSEKTVSKLVQVHSLGKNEGSAERKVAGSLNASDTIHRSGKAAHTRITMPHTVHQWLVLRPSISPRLPGPARGRS
jgi:hypothetical protein